MKIVPELLAPAGDFACLKAAVQNGANAVYLGSSSFNARACATNFDLDGLKEAIAYAHLRNCKVHVTLNTLIKQDELQDAFFLALKAYEMGIDAIIIQDLGLARLLHEKCPGLVLHASTQMSIHNLVGVLELEKLGFQRVVLSRELSINEISYICQNSNIEIEAFVHGALCISYSGQCLFSSMIGGRSGNRGKCAQACRLPYSLLENGSTIVDKGYLLSPKDVCSLELLPNLMESGIHSFKIEGRMKTPEYVATVTRIYRKYIDKLLANESFVIEEQDKKDLLLVFNRGGFSTGHLGSKANQELIFKEKPNHMGIYIGNIHHYFPNKGHVSLNLKEELELGDTISFQQENGKYLVSELMVKGSNITCAKPNQLVEIRKNEGKFKTWR